MDINPQFITFEGGEGVGKSTQIKKLQEYLSRRGIETIITREPGGSPGGESIRQLLVQGECDRWDAKTEVLLMNAARRDHVTKLIQPALQTGKWVLCDRFADSTLVYQGYARGVQFEELLLIQKFTCEGLKPHLTFVLDLEPIIGLQRTAARLHNKIENRFENMDLSMHQSIRTGFRKLIESDPHRYVLIDAAPDADTVFFHIQSHIDRLYFNANY